MSLWERLSGWFDRVTGRRRLDDDLQAEIEFHIAARAADLERGGLSRQEAHRQARLQFGATDRYMEEGREMSNYRYLDELRADLRDAGRGLRRDPSFSVLAVVIVTAVLAANMVLFAFLDAYFLRPLPIAGAERHVEVFVRDDRGHVEWGWPLADVERFLTAHADVLDAGYAFSTRRVIVGGKDPQRAYIEVVSAAYFDLLRPTLAKGRLPLARGQDGSSEPAVLLSDHGRRRLTGGDPDPIGRTLLVDGVSLTVVGLLPPDKGGLEPVTPDFWVLAGAADPAAGDEPALYHVAGLLRPGLSLEQAGAILDPTVNVLSPGAPESATRRLLLEPRTTLLREAPALQPLAVSLLLLFGIVTLIAAANLTSLHLARATARRRDFTIRTALGASRARLIRHILTESLLVSAVAALFAWTLSAASITALQGIVFRIVSEAGMSMQSVPVDGRIVAAGFLLAGVVGVVCGLTPALHTTRRSLAGALSRDGLWLSGRVSAGRLRGALVVLQVALSLPLLVGSGILLRNASRATRVGAGYTLDGLVDLRAVPPSGRLLDRLSGFPGAVAFSASAHTPLAGQVPRTEARIGEAVWRLGTNQVDERFFETVGFEVTRGRGFYAHEAATRAPVAVISEATARRVFGDENPLGRTIEIAIPRDDDGFEGERHPYEVVGVVADVMSGWFFEGLDASAVYVPARLETGLPNVLLRLDRETSEVLAQLRAACAELNVYCEPFPLRRILGQQQVPFRVASQVASSLGLLALGLACLGLYGLVRFTVVQRTRELGVRFALGATRARLLRSVLAESVRRSGLGVAIGLPICLAISTLLASRIPFLRSFDPLVYFLVPPVLLGFALLASLAPALRAVRLDPVAAIRED